MPPFISRIISQVLAVPPEKMIVAFAAAIITGVVGNYAYDLMFASRNAAPDHVTAQILAANAETLRKMERTQEALLRQQLDNSERARQLENARAKAEALAEQERETMQEARIARARAEALRQAKEEKQQQAQTPTDQSGTDAPGLETLPSEISQAGPSTPDNALIQGQAPKVQVPTVSNEEVDKLFGSQQTDDAQAAPRHPDASQSNMEVASIDPQSGQPTAPEIQPQITAPDPTITSFGVFEDESFDLCGYSGFEASLTGPPDSHDGILLKSRDRNIPDIPFRGFERKLPLETATSLWSDCIVLAGYSKMAGTIRIVLSVTEFSQ